MRKILVVIFFSVLSALPALAQEPPFYQLDNQIKQTQGGLAGAHEELSTLFNAERIRLGDRFETELLKYIGNDVEKHDWLSTFLVIPEYLHGNKPLPQLSLIIKQQAISILNGKTDQESRGDTLKLNVMAAVLSETLGYHSLAKNYQKVAQGILDSDSEFGAWFPAMDKYDRCLYDSLNRPVAIQCKSTDADKSHNNPMNTHGAFLNGLAVSLPKPIYPDEARAKRIAGIVEVQVIVDEEGKVEFAQSLSGDPLLQEAAVSAVRKARFSPTTSSGRPLKLIGRVVYNFVP